jgi:hypothetical protein
MMSTNPKRQEYRCRWSRTQQCGYVDYGKENFQKVKQVFPDIEIINDPEKRFCNGEWFTEEPTTMRP